MSSTVPSFFRSSGGAILPFAPAVPVQPAGEAGADAVVSPLRLVPSRIGPSGRSQVVHIECPAWCDTSHARVMNLGDISHYSDGDIVSVPTLLDEDTSYCELATNVHADPDASDPRLRAAHVVFNANKAEDAHLTPDMAEGLADELIAFAAQLRHNARVAREFNAAVQR